MHRCPDCGERFEGNICTFCGRPVPQEELEQEILKLEQEYPGSVSLSSGACLHCKNAECTRLSGKPCRFQDKMRYSIESLGGNVGKTVTKYLKQELQWVEEGKLPEYFMLIYGLLIP